MSCAKVAKERKRKRYFIGLVNCVSNYQFYPDIQSRRYKSGITNLFHIYLPLVDEWFLYDNSNLVTELIAEKTREKFVIIYNIEKWQLLNQVL